MPPAPFIMIILAIFAVSADGILYVLKKWEHGDWATKFQSLSTDAKGAVFACIPCCLFLSTAFAALIFCFYEMRSALIAVFFALVSHLVYRTLMLISDKSASKYVPQSKRKMKQARRIRRYFSLSFAIFALATAAVISSFFGKFLPKF